MFYNEHNPPHFHAIYNDYEAEIDIQTLEILAGDLPKRVRNLVLEWAIDHKVELMEDWNLMREKKKPNDIEPLL
jgi:hypothetical protein